MESFEAQHEKPSVPTDAEWSREVFRDSSGQEVQAMVKTFRDSRADHFLEVNLHREACRLCPGVVRVLDNNIEKGFLKLKLELCEQGSLLDVLKADRMPPKLEKLIATYDSMLTTIATLHAKRIAHRCIDMSNWLVTAAGEVKLSDFGQAKSIKSKETLQTHTIQGNRAYLEQSLLTGTAIVHSPFADDIWSLGKVFFEFAVRKAYMHLNTFNQQQLDEKIVRELSSFGCPPLTHLILGMLHTDPKQRLTAQSALEALHNLQLSPQTQDAFDGPCPSCIGTPEVTFPCRHAACTQCWKQKVDECVKLECPTCQQELQIDDLLKNTEAPRALKLEVLKTFQMACELRKKSWKR